MKQAQCQNRKLELRFHEGFRVPKRTLATKMDILEPIVEVTFNRKPPVFASVENIVPPQIVGTGQKLEALKARAAELRALGEKARICSVLELVRQNMAYPYPGTEAEARFKTVEKEAKDYRPKEDLSVFVEAGVGACRHFAPFYGVLGVAAGLDVEVLYGYVSNFLRPDTDQPAFRLLPFGSTEAHTWNEVHLRDEKVPVDPTVGMACFDDASKAAHYGNYRAKLGAGDKVSVTAPNRILNILQSFDISRTRLICRITVDDKPIVAPMTASFDMEIQTAKPLVERLELLIS